MKPRYYQEAASSAAWNYLRNKAGNPLIVLPTGAGKSLVIAMMIKQAMQYDARVIVLQHRKELIEQNAEKIRILCPGVDVGVNSAGLKTRNYDQPVVFAGIQSVYKKATEFGRRELILIDEAHLVGDSDNSMYGQFLGELMAINAKARIVGLTATPYRTGEGKLCGPNKMFQAICYEIKTGKLINEGYLCRLTNRSTDSQADMSNVRISRGDYVESDMQRAFLEVVDEACRELVAKTQDRKSILVFSAGVAHAKAIAEAVAGLTNEKVQIITGDTLPIERSAWLNDFKAGRLRWLINCMVLTTGFDAPRIDALGILRATTSPGLFAQIVGRGLRKHESKDNCHILDFGGNIARHGSLDSDSYGESKEKKEGGEAPTKDCPNCEEPSAISASVCETCGFRFPPPDPADKHDTTADEESVLIGEAEPEVWLVQSVGRSVHQKRGDATAPPSLRIDYRCNMEQEEGNLTSKIISEWVCIEHEGYTRRKAVEWWTERSIADCPQTVEEAIEKIDRGMLRMPNVIKTKLEDRWPRIVDVQFVDEKPDPEDWVDLQLYADDEVPF